MRRILFILIIVFGTLYAKPTDVYFANGILTSKEQAKQNAKLLTDLLARPDIPKVYVAYNHTFDSHFVKGGPDLFESLLQKLSVMKRIDMWLSNDERVTVHQYDLNKQISAFKNSINEGRKVLVVAHSQGNLFTNEAYESLNEEGLDDAFDALSIASPMFSNIKKNTITYSWDNDLVADLALNPLRKRYYCDIRKIEWIKNRTYPKHSEPKVVYIYKENKDNVYKNDWIAKEPFVATFDSNVHAFTFYIGEVLKDGDTGFAYHEVFQGRTLQTTVLKEKILDAVNTIIDKNSAITTPTNLGTETNTTTGGGTNPGETFDYQSQCSAVEFPDPIPTQLETSINEIITNVGSSIVASVVCPLIDTVVKAYNLTNGGGIPSSPL